MNKSADFLTCEILDQVLCQFGAGKRLVKNESDIETTFEKIEVECQIYPLVVLASVLGALTPMYMD